LTRSVRSVRPGIEAALAHETERNEKVTSRLAFTVVQLSKASARVKALVGRCRLTPGWKPLTPRLLSSVETNM